MNPDRNKWQKKEPKPKKKLPPYKRTKIRHLDTQDRDEENPKGN
jgi:hypothetical protein